MGTDVHRDDPASGPLRSPRPGYCRNLGHRDALIYGDIVMRILSRRQLKELVLYSPQHIARLEKAGADLPLKFHPAAIRASALFTPCGAV